MHLVLNEISGGTDLPAWLNEGLATYLEYELGLQGVRPNAARRDLYRSADAARSSVVSGPFLPLTGLESQSRWMAQTDDAIIRLMYAEAHMAVRLLIEDHGADAPVRVMLELTEGGSLQDALQTVTGRSYLQFRDRFVSWLQTWEDPARAAIGQYARELDDILAAESAIFARRSAYLDSGLPIEQSRPLSAGLVADSRDLQVRLRGLVPGESLTSLHDDATEFLASLVNMLTLERDYLESGIESKRTEAGKMIPELFGRVFRLQRDLSTVQFNYQLKPAG